MSSARGQRRLPYLFRLSCVCLMLSSCATSGIFSEHTEAFRRVRSQPGQVAWAPGSELVAVVSGPDLLLVGPAGGILRTFAGIHPRFLSWTEAGTLLVVHGSPEGGTRVSRGSPPLWDIAPVPGTSGAIAVFPVPGSEDPLSFHVNARKQSVGTFIDIRIERVSEGHVREVETTHVNLPPDASVERYLAGSTYAPIRPYFDTVLVPQYRKPPMFPPRIELSTRDPLTGEVHQIGVLNLARYSSPVAWSPDGNTLAYPDDSGFLNLLPVTAGGSAAAASAGVTGGYVSWHPERKVLFFGGFLLDVDGNSVARIAGSDEKSMGVWSPDGRHLALLGHDGLSLRNDLEIPDDTEAWTFPVARSSARDGLRVLKKLYIADLISREDYESRSQKHMEVLLR